MKLRRGSFERRLLLALALISLVPSLFLLGTGTFLLRRAVQLHTSPAAWEQVRESGRDLLMLADSSGDPALGAAADQHRQILDFSLQQSRLWEYVNARVLRLIPIVAMLLAALLTWLSVRSARKIARELARPIHELVGWSRLVAREQPLPPAVSTESSDDFGVLREAFHRMADELADSRVRALEAERARTWVAVARGVAHELKNSLTPLKLALRAMERAGDADPTLREPLEVATAESAQLEELARIFAQFGHLPEGPMSEIDLVEQLEYLLRTHLPPSVDHELVAPPDLPRVHAHHDALSRAFANLLLNAVEAMAEAPGTIRVELSSGEGVVVVRLIDSGPGIPPDRIDRIWDPDFTTKARGTGLGLALVRQTVQAHGGSIRALNLPEGGAEFRVTLPIEGPSVVPRPEDASP